MRTRGLRLGRLAGVEINADFGVLLICAFLAWSFSSGLLPAAVPGHVAITYWSVGTVGAIAFIASLLGHEMSHSMIAKRNGLTVEGITLWMFGGVAVFSGEPKGPGAEFRIAAAGPAASFAIGAAFWGAAAAFANTLPDLWVVMLGWLGVINVFLAVFNLLPGAPLDGGRILGSIIWKVRGDRAAGRQGAAQVGKVLGLLLVAGGIAEMIFTDSGVSGIWTAMIGWFLFNAARNESSYYAAERSMAGVSVASVMLSPVQVAVSWSSVAAVVNGPFATSEQTFVPVTDATGRVVGVVHLDQLKRVPAQNWQTVTAADVMESPPNAAWVEVSDSMSHAMELMAQSGYAFVVDGSDLVGLIGPDEIERAAKDGPHRKTKGGPHRETKSPTTPAEPVSTPAAMPASPPLADPVHAVPPTSAQPAPAGRTVPPPPPPAPSQSWSPPGNQ